MQYSFKFAYDNAGCIAFFVSSSVLYFQPSFLCFSLVLLFFSWSRGTDLTRFGEMFLTFIAMGILFWGVCFVGWTVCT
ncbi:hypothetical protein FPQ18DRAFT_69849 [Pyronema domesticum]|nr:hypothetical protein FPQ18DRAFT_69849 [Pyronema domesticum]